ncbi:MAG: hypothetical protein CL609_21165 [Anaerolineaceae bacterium]|nr:hypothetical protein [Anaerolineaceae bacterium]
MKKKFEKYIQELELNEGLGSIDEFRKDHPFPEDVIEFYKYSNGAIGSIGKGYIQLWSSHEMEQMEELYMIRSIAPNLLFLGSDGGGEVYAYDKKKKCFVMYPYFGDYPNDVIDIAKDFFAFIQKIYNGNNFK